MSYQSQQQDQRKLKAITVAISGAANNGSGLIRITSATHPFQTGDRVQINNVVGTVEANGKRDITRITGTTFDLIGSTFTNAYVSGGTAKRVQN